MRRRAIAEKLKRLATGARPRVLDLFSGCGGLSLGFHAAGFDIVGAVENDPVAAASHHLNFGADHNSISGSELARDITTTDPLDLMSRLTPAVDAVSSVDVIVGGPPCQAFARVGRAKLREVRDHPKAFKQDPRSNLYLRYLHYVEQLQPVALLMENVPDAINFGGHNIAEETCDVLKGLGYVARYTLLNAVHYGVPQTRERMFLIAYAQEISTTVQFPAPTHSFKLPRGYEGSRRVALRHVRRDGPARQLSLLASSSYVEPPDASRDLGAAVTAREALHDLPRITAHLRGHLPRGTRHLEDFVPYRRVTPSPYAELMRSWPGFESNGGVCDHVIRSLSTRDFEIFRRMKPGDQYPEAHKIAIAIRDEELERLRGQEDHMPISKAAFSSFERRFVPPYDPEKFPNKWRKMTAGEPARTLMAHLGKDSYSHIHYDSSQARTISVREAARLMSFPDGFRFCGTMNPAFRQIGNAVPPLLALAIARTMARVVTGEAWNPESLLSA